MENNKFAFSKTNYILLLTGIGILILGFFLMSIDRETFGFGFLGLTLGPIIVMAGFVFQFFAIFYKSNKDK